MKPVSPNMGMVPHVQSNTSRKVKDWPIMTSSRSSWSSSVDVDRFTSILNGWLFIFSEVLSEKIKHDAFDFHQISQPMIPGYFNMLSMPIST